MTFKLTVVADDKHAAYLAIQVAAGEFLAGETKYDSDSADSSITFEVFEDEPAPA